MCGNGQKACQLFGLVKALLYGDTGFWKGAGGPRSSVMTAMWGHPPLALHGAIRRGQPHCQVPVVPPAWGYGSWTQAKNLEQCSQCGLGKYVFRDLLQQTAHSQLILKAPLELLGSVV